MWITQDFGGKRKTQDLPNVVLNHADMPFEKNGKTIILIIQIFADFKFGALMNNHFFINADTQSH